MEFEAHVSLKAWGYSIIPKV